MAEKLSDKLPVTNQQPIKQEEKLVSILQAIINKLPFLLVLYQNTQTQDKVQKSIVIQSTKYETYIPIQLNQISTNIKETLETVEEVFRLYQANSNHVGEEMLQAIQQVIYYFNIVSQCIADIHNKLQQNVPPNELFKFIKEKGINHTVIETKKDYLKSMQSFKIRHSLDHIDGDEQVTKSSPQKMRQKKDLIHTPISTVGSATGNQKQFINYVLMEIKKIKKHHAMEIDELDSLARKNEAALSNCKIQLANALNRNEELCEDISQFQQKIKILTMNQQVVSINGQEIEQSSITKRKRFLMSHTSMDTPMSKDHESQIFQSMEYLEYSQNQAG